MRICTLAAAALLAGCAAASGSASGPAPTPCPSAIRTPAGTPWRQVRAEGFTFCVPASWKPTEPAPADTLDPRAWRGGEGTLRWSAGPYRPSGTGPVTVLRREGDPAPAAETRTFSEVIGGRPAELWSHRYGERRFTGAEWARPRRVHLTGEAASAATAALQLDVYRTVRFTAP